MGYITKLYRKTIPKQLRDKIYSKYLRKILYFFRTPWRNICQKEARTSEMKLLNLHHINLVFDIGANVGNYAKQIRKYGYQEKIISVEPIPEVFAKLKKRSHSDKKWEVINSAVGDTIGETKFNLSQDSECSSILPMKKLHEEEAKNSKYIGEIVVPITTMNQLINEYSSTSDKIFVKIDTQGFEKTVFDGCAEVMDKICGFQMELSLVTPLYEGETLFVEMIQLLKSKGFYLASVSPGFRAFETGQLLQSDCIFYKSV